jgi:hypothetical protein
MCLHPNWIRQSPLDPSELVALAAGPSPPCAHRGEGEKRERRVTIRVRERELTAGEGDRETDG